MGYTKKIDRLIYQEDAAVLQEFTESDWRQLAIAAADQGGLCIEAQNVIARLIGSPDLITDSEGLTNR